MIEIPKGAKPFLDKLAEIKVTPWDVFVAIVMLDELPRHEVARLVGKSPPYVTAMRQIHDRAIEEVLFSWRDGLISFEIARLIAKAKEDRDQATLLINYLRDTEVNNKKTRGEAKHKLLEALKGQQHARKGQQHARKFKIISR